jgi:hypothetical protein
MTKQPDSTPTPSEVEQAEAIAKLPLFKRIVRHDAKPFKVVKVFPKKKR